MLHTLVFLGTTRLIAACQAAGSSREDMGLHLLISFMRLYARVGSCSFMLTNLNPLQALLVMIDSMMLAVYTQVQIFHDRPS